MDSNKATGKNVRHRVAAAAAVPHRQTKRRLTMRTSGQSLKLWWGGPRRWLFGLGAAALIAAMPAAPAQAATSYVANNGLDTSPCTKSMPCRSITRALGMAAPGDTVEVGPGIYGDIDGSGTVGDFAGEEIPAPSYCMIDITFPVTLVSKDGAGSTVLDAGGSGLTKVCIRTAGASGAVFGKLNKGFTVRNGWGGGVDLSDAAGVKVQGNVVEGGGYDCFDLFNTNAATVKNNIATNCRSGGMRSGFYLQDTTGTVLTGNLANASDTGFLVNGNSGTVVTKNVAVGNLVGFEIVGDETEMPVTASNNTAAGNLRWGLDLMFSGSAGPGSVTLTKNNFFGNGEQAFGPFPPNCGLVVVNGGLTGVTVNASGNFWGAATGPGPNPADMAGGSCNQDLGSGITLTTTPVATTKLPLYPPKMK